MITAESAREMSKENRQRRVEGFRRETKSKFTKEILYIESEITQACREEENNFVEIPLDVLFPYGIKHWWADSRPNIDASSLLEDSSTIQNYVNSFGYKCSILERYQEPVGFKRFIMKIEW